MISSKVGDATQFIDDGKDHPHDWADADDYDDVFDEEFRHVTNNPNVPESGPDFTPNVLDDTYLNMELALPRSGGEVEFARVVSERNAYVTKMVYRSVLTMTTQCWIQDYMRWNSPMDMISHHYLLM
jgi:hypothetical protein